MDKAKSHDYLSSLLNKNLRIYTSDGRLFWGSFKCTDHEKNIVLSSTYEYRTPSGGPPLSTELPGDTVTVDMTSRYLGLVVVPGEYIIKMEVEEFASQMKP